MSTSAMARVNPARPLRILARLILALLAVSTVLLVAVPWQQTAHGTGRVIAYAPDERRQKIEAPIEGRVKRWHVHEGSFVKQGAPIVDLADVDPDILSRLRGERDAVERRVEAARARVRSMEARVAALTDSRRSAIAAADSRIRMATQRALAANQALELANATLAAAVANTERQRSLADKGLTSTRQLELVELEETRARTEVERAKVALSGARSEELAFTADRAKVNNDATASIDDARATQLSAEGEVANATAELTRIEVRLARQTSQSVLAPRDGTVLGIAANGQTGEIVRVGDILATFVPETTDRAVEVWVSGRDMPLVRPGIPVRLEFEGWPALQVSGWPSVAVGTFGGKVELVDAADDGAGRFRVIVTPDPDDPWPEAPYLRQGVRAAAWIQLGRVSLGFEMWRQLNGLPPSPSESGAPIKTSATRGAP